MRLVVPPDILEAVLATAASGEGVGRQLAALREAVTGFAVAEGATPESADQAAGLYIDLLIRGLANPAAGDALAQNAFNDRLLFGDPAAAADPAEQLLAALSGGEGLDAAVTRLLQTLPETAGLEGEALATARAGFLASLQDSLAAGGGPGEAIAAAQLAIAAASAEAAANAGSGDDLAGALASGEDVTAAIADAQARAGLDPDSDAGGAAIFETALARALGGGAGTGAAMDRAAGQAEAVEAAQAESAVPMSPVDQLRLALSAGAGSEGFDAILRQFGLDGVSGDAFADALQRALAQGNDIAEAVAGAEEAEQQATDAEAEQQVPVTPADQLAQALANGQQVDQALALVGGEAGGEAFATALAGALSQGGDMSDAIRSGGQAATASQNAAANQNVEVSAADQLVAALSSGDAADASLAVASLSAGGGAAFANQLIASLASGNDAGSSVSQARTAGEAAAAVAQAQAVPVSATDQAVLALAQGGGQGTASDGTAGSGGSVGGSNNDGLDAIAQALAAISPAAGGQASSANAAAGGAADSGTAAVAQGSDSGSATGDGAAAAGGEAGSTGAGVTQSVQVVGNAGAGGDAAGAAAGSGGTAAGGAPAADGAGEVPAALAQQGDGTGQDGAGQTGQQAQTQQQAATQQQSQPSAGFTQTMSLAGNGSAGIGSAGSAPAGNAQAGNGTAGSQSAGNGQSSGTATTASSSTTTSSTNNTTTTSSTTATTATTTTTTAATGTTDSATAGSGSTASGSAGTDTADAGTGGTADGSGSGSGDSSGSGSGGSGTDGAGDSTGGSGDSGGGGSDTLTGGSGGDQIGGGNTAPRAVADSVVMVAGSSRSVDVLGNDSDPDAGDSLTLLSLETPSRGSARIDGGRILFDAGTGFQSLAGGSSEVVGLVYTVRDSSGATASASLSVTVSGVNDAPVGRDDAAATGENDAVTIDVLGNDSDPDIGDSLTLTGASLAGGRGSATIVGNRLKFDPGSAFDHLTDGESETVTIGYTMVDSQGLKGSASLTVTVTGTNDRPFAAADTATMHEDQAQLVNVVDNDGDAEDAAAGLTLVSYTLLSGAGSLSSAGQVLIFYPASSYQSMDQGDTAEIRIGYVVADSAGLQAGSTVTILMEGRNDAPVAVADTASPTEDATLTLDVLANDTDIDEDDEPANFVLQSVSLESGLGTVSVVDNKLFYDPGSSYQSLDAGDTATVAISYVMADDSGATATETVTLTVRGVNDAPVAAADSGSLTEDATLTLDVLANDADVDGDDDPSNFVLQSVSLASGLGTASVVGNKLFYDPGSSYQFLDPGDTATVTIGYVMADDSGATATQTVTLTVTGANDAPVGVADTAAIAENGTPVTVNVLANDTDVDGDDDPSGFTVTAASTATGKGSVSIVGNAVRFDPGTDFDYLAAGATEEVAVSYTVSDDGGATATGTLTVTVTGANDAPGGLQSHRLRFDGVNDHVTVADHGSLDFAAGTAFSVDAWIRLDSATGRYTIIDKPSGAGDVTNYRLFVNNGQLGVYNDVSGALSAATATVGAGTWTHVAMAYDGSTVTLYSDGVAVLTTAWTLGAVNSGDLMIGRDIQGRYFDGEMADLRIWKTELSQDAVQHLMRQDTARDHAGLVADYDFASSGTTLTDSAGTAQNGTLQNGTAWTDSSSLAVSRGEAYRGLLLASDIDLDPFSANLSYSVSTAASHGTVTLSGNTYTYLNDGTNNGADSFRITISDGSATVVETINVSVNTGNRAPTAPSLKAIRLDGVNDYISFNDSGVFDRSNGGELTAQAWIKLDSVNGHVPIFDKPTGADNNPSNWRLEVVDGQLRLWSSSGGSVDQTGGASIQADSWYNVAVTVSSAGYVRIYLDGEMVGSAVDWTFGSANSGPFYIGRDGAGRYMDGEIAQMRIWQDHLNQTEIQAGMSRKATDSLTYLWAHFNLDGSGTTVIDQGGGVAQNGTLKNGASRVDLVSIGIENDDSYSGIVLGDEPDANIRSQSLTYSLASQPKHGTVTLTGNKFTYDHAGDGQNDSFDVFISDGTAVTRQTIDVTIVNNTAPVLAESNSLSFDGTDDFVTIAHDAALSFGSGDAFSLDLWVKPDTIAGNTVLLDKAGSLVSQSNYRLELDQGGIRIWSWDNAGATSDLVVGNAGIVAGSWSHIAFGYDGSGTGHLYLNGVEIGSGSWTPQFSSGDPLLLGKAVDGRFYGGGIGDVRVWSRQLSANEIQNLMSQDARTDLSGLVLDLDFGGSGSTVVDDAGTAQNGTLDGAQRVSSTAIDVLRDGSYRGLLLGNDAETTPLTGQLNYAVSAGPSNGTVTFDGNRYVYEHDGSDTSSDSFTVSISDGSAIASQVITVTVNSAVAAPSFKAANALVLDGVDDYLTTPDMSALDRSGTDALTLEAWIKADTLDGHFALFDKSPDLTTDNANYRFEIQDGILKLYSNGGIDFRQTVGTVSAGEWHHVAATYDGAGNAALYLDGALVGATAGWSYTGAENDGAFVIGRDSSPTGRHFDGQIAEARYWTSALSQAEIQNAMTRAAGDADLPLAIRYDFGGTGTTVTDDAGSTAQNGTLQNGAARSDLLAIAVQNDAVYRGLLLADDIDSSAWTTALSYEIAGKPTHGSLILNGNRFTYDHVGDGQNDSFAIWVSDGSNRTLKTFTVSTSNATPQLAETSIVNLDGIDDYLSIADHDDLDFTGNDAFSLELWINPDEVFGTTVLLDKRWGDGGNDTNVRLELDDGGIRLYNDDGSGGVSNIYADTQAITAGRWHHVVAAYDGAGTATIYIDGAQAASGSYANRQAGNTELFIGRAIDGRYYDGQIGDIRIWSKALSLDEITTLKSQDSVGDHAGLVLDLDFTGSGGTVSDDAGAAQDATLTNGAARVATGSAVTVANDGVHYGLLLAQDSDINPLAYGLSYSITLTPEHGNVTLDGNRFTYDHNGDGQNDSFEVTISDGAASVSQTVNVTVDGSNTPPGLSAMHAVMFDGSDDYISVADHAGLDFGATDPITLEAWIHPDSVTGEHNIFDKTDVSSGFDNNYRLYLRDGVLGFHNSVDGNLESGAVVSANEWTHVALTYDGTTARLYKDGAEVAAGARQLGPATDTALTIGRDEVGRFFDGQMTEMRIWDKALSQAEIQTGMTRKVDQATANLVLQFDADAVAGGQVSDGSGNGHAGTLQNGAQQADLKAVQIANNSVYKGLLLGTDGQGTAISAGLDYHLASAPEHGTLSMSGNEFTYDHDGSGANDSFQVAVDDGSTTSYHDVTFTVV